MATTTQNVDWLGDVRIDDDGTNAELTFTINGESVTVTLPSASVTQALTSQQALYAAIFGTVQAP